MQRSALKKEVKVDPPSELKNDGMIWVLKKVVKDPYDEGWQFHLKVEEALKELGCKNVTRYVSMYTFHNRQGELNGLVYPHAEDLNSAGTEEFHSRVTDILQMRFTVGNKDEP